MSRTYRRHLHKPRVVNVKKQRQWEELHLIPVLEPQRFPYPYPDLPLCKVLG